MSSLATATTAALGATALCTSVAFGLEVEQADGAALAAYQGPSESFVPSGIAQNAPSSIFLNNNAGFAQPPTATVEFDVAGLVGAIANRPEQSQPGALGRVAVTVTDDSVDDRAPDATDPGDPLVRAIEQRRGGSPVSARDVAFQSEPARPSGTLQLAYTAPFSSRINEGLSLAVEPRANIVVGRDVSGVGYGAIVRLGQDFASPREKSSRWYAFIGVDAQALTWSPEPSGAGDIGLRLEHKTLVGDAQAGVAVRVGEGDLSLGYIHREVRYEHAMSDEDISRVERYVGVSYTIRR